MDHARGLVSDMTGSQGAQPRSVETTGVKVSYRSAVFLQAAKVAVLIFVRLVTAAVWITK